MARKGKKTRLNLSACRYKKKGTNLQEWRERRRDEMKSGPNDPASSFDPGPPKLFLMVPPEGGGAQSGRDTTSSDSDTGCKPIFGTRLVDLSHFVRELQKLDHHGDADCNLRDMDMIGERAEGFRSCLRFKCRVCIWEGDVWTESNETDFTRSKSTAMSAATDVRGARDGKREVMADTPRLSEGYWTRFQKKVATSMFLKMESTEGNDLDVGNGGVEIDGTSPFLKIADIRSLSEISYGTHFMSEDTWNDMKKTTRAKILQRRTAGTDGPLVKLSPVQKRIAGLMCPFRSRCTVTTTNQETINTNFLEPQTCLDEGEPLSIPDNGVNEAREPQEMMPIIAKVGSNNLTYMTEPITEGYHVVNGADWNNTTEMEENEVPESPESRLQDHSLVNSTCVNNFGPGSHNHAVTNGSRVSSSSPGLQYRSVMNGPNVTSGNNYTGHEKGHESDQPQGDSDKFFEYQKQSAEALSQLAESHRKMAEAALRTATAEERKASALEQLVALLT